jgi:hypothetical protein
MLIVATALRTRLGFIWFPRNIPIVTPEMNQQINRASAWNRKYVGGVLAAEVPGFSGAASSME